MNETDKRLLDIIQDDFPLIREPFHEIASPLNISPDDVILRLKQLKKDGMIRRIGAIFDSKKLGYCSTLCAMKVPDWRVDEVAQIINGYAGVTHNYVRDHVYNIWFTITAKSQQELSRIMAEIKEKIGIRELIDLPATQVFKIRVRFPVTNTLSTQLNAARMAALPDPASSIQHPASEITLTEVEKSIIREVQRDIPLCENPFGTIAAKIGLDTDELLEKIRRMKEQGIMRRFGAIVRHRNLGYRANAMAVWVVPDDRTEEVGLKMAEFSQVSHCYQRAVRHGWPYNLFTMIHGESLWECEEIARLISGKTGIRDYKMLYSTRELKKISMKYFTEEG